MNSPGSRKYRAPAVLLDRIKNGENYGMENRISSEVGRRHRRPYYLALVGPDGTVRQEIHGHIGPNHRLIHVSGIKNPEVPGAAKPILVGDADEVDAVWDQLLKSANHLHGKATYGLLSPNSNAFWSTVLRLSGFDYRQYEPTSDLPTPGTGVDLSNPLWWTPEHRWPGVPVPPERDPPAALPAHRRP